MRIATAGQYPSLFKHIRHLSELEARQRCFSAVVRLGMAAEAGTGYCTTLVRSLVYSSLEMVPAFFSRSSFSISSATL